MTGSSPGVLYLNAAPPMCVQQSPLTAIGEPTDMRDSGFPEQSRDVSHGL